MDFSKIFLKGAKPTSIGGQAVIDGVMMKGPDRTALAMRLPSNEIYLQTQKHGPKTKIEKIPLIRGVVAFVKSLIEGMKTIMRSADIAEEYADDECEDYEEGIFAKKMTDKFGEKAVWNLMMISSVILAIIFTVFGFIIFPTIAVSCLKKYIENPVILNLIEGIFRIILFIVYVAVISRMKEMKELFMYHGAEHKSIHCFENGLELTPQNAQQFYTLHPRCGTSFLVFVMIVSLLLFSFLGWPNVWMRILSRILLIPVIAGISYELLRWAGRSDNIIVKILSTPGLLLQKLTTNEPNEEQIEIALTALKAVLVPKEDDDIDGIVDKDAKLLSGKKLSEELDKDTQSYENNDRKKTGKCDAEKKPKRIYEGHPYCVKNVIRKAQDKLENKENGKGDAVEIFCYLMGFSHSDIVIHKDDVLKEQVVAEYGRLIEIRDSGVPLQHITKVQVFMGLPMKVSNKVLIPRLDTEVLAEQTIGIIKGEAWKEPEILDMCTGSGALGISVAYNIPDAHLTMTDISREAISIAMGNAQINEVFDRCRFILGDMFKALPTNKKYNMIISNPPYIPTDVIDVLSDEVKFHEPHIALDGGEDGYDFYRCIAENADSFIKDGGILALETGHDQAKNVAAMLRRKETYENVSIVKDLTGTERIVIAEKAEKE